MFVTEIVTGIVGGPVSTVVDTRGPFGEFGFRPPALNNAGDVAFSGTLDDFATTGVFVGPDPVADRVIAVGDTLDGEVITGLRFCEEGAPRSTAPRRAERRTVSGCPTSSYPAARCWIGSGTR